jgi:asparagine synthase (glutamine-hydrolysing)
MCGIAGIVNINGNKAPLDLIKRMTDAIAHRGPDGEGFWNNPRENVAFGHRRLSIIDLSVNGAQPMHYFDKRYTIVYNGEIYNYLELKADLVKKGFKFHTESDTEVLLSLYHLKREGCLNDLDGMFSFAIWDEQEQELFCARDRFGEKPFHYFFDGNTFVFASEIKALLAGGIKKEIDLEKVQQYLNNAACEYPIETFFKNIIKLEQSHFLQIKDGKLSIKKYFELVVSDNKIYNRESDYVERFNELFLTSIKRRLRSDVAVGTSLSGGLDSSSVVCYMNTALGNVKNQKAFSARFHDHKNDEGKWIDIIKQKTGIVGYEVYPDPLKIVDDITAMTYSQETPLGSTSNCAQYYVMQLAKENNVKVILDGQGADEYLAGYEQYRQYALWEMFYNFKFGKFFTERNQNKQVYGKNFPLGYYFMPRALYSKIFKPGNVDNRFYQSLKSKLKYDLMYNLPVLLTYADRNAMAHSVETRLPFLFHELVNFVLSCPKELIYNNATTKVILRKAIQGTVPDEIINRIDKLNYIPRQELWLHYFNISNKQLFNSLALKESKSYWRNYAAIKFIETFNF